MKLIAKIISYLLVPGFRITIGRKNLRELWADESGNTIISDIIVGNKAAEAQKEAARTAAGTQREFFEEIKAINAPFVSAGTGALGLLSDIFVGGQTDKLLGLPGIDFLREQGEQAIGRAQSARGNFLSGAGVKEAIRFNQGLASTNLAQVTNPLFAISQLGQSSAAFTGSAALATGQGVAQTNLISGQAESNRLINIGSSINTGINNALFLAAGGGGGVGVSDIRVKENITPTESVLEKIAKPPVYDWNYIGDDKKRTGPMAQDIEKVFPEMIIERDGIKYIDLVTANGILWKALQELMAKVESKQ